MHRKATETLTECCPKQRGNPTRCTFQSYGVTFSHQKLMHAYYAFTSYVGRKGHLYKVLLVLATGKSHLISDKMCRL